MLLLTWEVAVLFFPMSEFSISVLIVLCSQVQLNQVRCLNQLRWKLPLISKPLYSSVITIYRTSASRLFWFNLRAHIHHLLKWTSVCSCRVTQIKEPCWLLTLRLICRSSGSEQTCWCLHYSEWSIHDVLRGFGPRCAYCYFWLLDWSWRGWWLW
jgi:hypothetical protein